METFTNSSEEVSLKNKSEGASEPSDVEKGFFVLALSLVFVFNLLGNSMVLCVVHHQWKNVRQRVTNSLIGNLACIDLLVAILVFFSIIIAVKGRSGLTYTKCQIDGFLSNLVGSASIPTMAVIAIDRYLVIVLGHGRRLKLRTARVLIACVWIMAILVSLFPILFWGKYHSTKKSTQCKAKDGSFFVLLAIVFFVIPLATMLFCYVSIFLKVRRHKQMMNSQEGRNRSFKTEFRTTKIVFTVLATFIVLWTPFVVVYVSSTNSDSDSIPPSVFMFCGFLTALHSMCNPIIYFGMNKKFRKTAVKLTQKILPCILAANENSTTCEQVSCDLASSSAKTGTLVESRKASPAQCATNEFSDESKSIDQ